MACIKRKLTVLTQYTLKVLWDLCVRPFIQQDASLIRWVLIGRLW